VKAGDAGRLREWLADPRVVAHDPPTLERLRAQLTDPPTRLLVGVEPHGSVVIREPSYGPRAPRRVLELDRHGTVLAILRWTEAGPLARAWTRITDDSWVMIEPRATREAPWGLCDRLWHAAHPSAAAPVPLTVFEALTYERIDRIPVLAEPARLPTGTGAAVLNLVAALAADAGASRLPYRGPYPTERLFLALLESFRYDTDEADPLAGFMSGRVEWSPAPCERVCLPSGVTAHLRGRIEKVAWRERHYHRPDWQGIRRHASRRVRDVDGAVVCSLWALGEPVEDHLRLDPDGARVEVIMPRRPAAAPRPLPDPVLAGLASAVAALGAAALAPFVREVAAGCTLTWASVDGDLVAVRGPHLRVSDALRELLARRLRRASTRAQRLALGLAALTELAQLFGDALRASAQARLAAQPPEIQAQHLADPTPSPPGADDARYIAQAVEALVAALQEDEPSRSSSPPSETTAPGS
jgi:hypothetical protein